ncbi:alpha/beta hydrolase family protein [Actinokineospora globicatena]|uniref:alpha/beta hydrolase family protein n=1 Tax=Actinokineospora globicatena TaxID=103729 RepID=UPI0025523C5D|nr:prolyl oligopeptidase family serine peptidase [Actinokineospora globicatena]
MGVTAGSWPLGRSGRPTGSARRRGHQRPLGQAVYFHRALRRFGAECEFVIYPGEGHSIRERGHRLDVLRRTRAWFERWLQP